MSETMNQTEQVQAYTMQDFRDLTGGMRNQINRAVVIEPEDLDIVLGSVFTYGGHLLLEGPAGTGKTLLAESIGKSVDATVGRIQGQPGLMPSDISGKEIFRPNTGEFTFLPGPILKNIPFADEINRFSTKTQAALLQPMAEGNVTVGTETYSVPEFSMVIATQNPNEDGQGTNPLTRAQTDRFMSSVAFAPHDATMDLRVMNKIDEGKKVSKVASIDQILAAREFVKDVNFGDNDKKYTTELVDALRNSNGVDIELSALGGARASIAIRAIARSVALLRGEQGVSRQDIDVAAMAVLGHRVVVSHKVDNNVTSKDLINDAISTV